MNPLAQSLNEQLQQSNATAFTMLSDLGQNMFYPKGILSQSAEAKSTTYNATIGMATNKDGKMFASSLDAMFNDLTPDEIFLMRHHKASKNYVIYGNKKCCVTIQSYQSTTCHYQLLRMH